MSHQSIYLLSTAALPGDLIGEAATRNIVLEIKSFIATEPLPVPDLPELLARPLVAVFTSANAVESIADAVESSANAVESSANAVESIARGLTAARPSRAAWRIYCIGGATRQVVAETFGESAVAGTADSAAALAGNIRQREARGEIFFFSGDRRREELPALLTEAGFTVLERMAYRTILTPQRTEREYAGIAFFSPNGVESFFAANAPNLPNPLDLPNPLGQPNPLGLPNAPNPPGAPGAAAASGPKTIMFAIGPTTAEAIRTRCPNPVVVGDRPDKTLLIQKMTDYFDKRQK